MENIDALQAIERGERVDQDTLLRLHEAKLIDISNITRMQSEGPEFIFVGFTPEGFRLLKQSKAPLVSDLEREIINVIVRGSLDRHEATSKRALLKQFKSTLTRELQRLVDRSVLQMANNNTYPNEAYLPRAIAFYHCGDSAALAFARKSTEIVLRVLPILFDRELEGEGDDQKQFTPEDVLKEAQAIYSSVEPNAIFTGLYLAQEFSVFSGMRRDDRQVGIVSFSLGERVYETRYLDWDEHIRRSNVSLVHDQNTNSKSMPVGVPSSRPLDLQRLLPRLDSHSGEVFLVHGHAPKPKQAVSAFLRSAGLQVIILHEKANQGQTIIEKFEKHSDVGFAVVLLTPDDVGASALHPENTHRRARQNVILELGYFLAKLGRDKVCCLYVEGVELPSDYDGVLYVPYDDAGAWRSKLAKELTAAGIEFDSQSLSAQRSWDTVTDFSTALQVRKMGRLKDMA